MIYLLIYNSGTRKDDHMLSFFSNIFTVIFLWGLFTFTMYILRIRKVMRQYKNNPNIQGIQIVNGKVHVIEKENNIVDAKIREETKDLVQDPVCHAEIEKTSAYRIVKNDTDYYFCSWECREKFLESVE